MHEVKLTGVVIGEDCSKSHVKSFSATGQCTQGEFKGKMHFSEIQMNYCFTSATHVLIVSDSITFNTLLRWQIPIFQLMGICCRRILCGYLLPTMGDCYRSKNSVNFTVGVCYHNGYLLP